MKILAIKYAARHVFTPLLFILSLLITTLLLWQKSMAKKYGKKGTLKMTNAAKQGLLIILVMLLSATAGVWFYKYNQTDFETLQAANISGRN